MRIYQQLVALVVLIASTCSIVNAHSAHPPLLKRAANPSTIALEIIPRAQPISDFNDLHRRSPAPAPHTLRFDDTFRLTLSAFGETFHLHLRPNDHLIHPAARINYFRLNDDGVPTLHRTEPLLRESVKAYLGEVVAAYHSPKRMKEDAAGVVPKPHVADLGWARILVHHQGDRTTGPIYEGAFSANGVVYHISTKENYLMHKHEHDADVAEVLDGSDERLVVWRDSDEMTPEEEHLVKTGSLPTEPVVRPSSCAHDSLEENTDPRLNPALSLPREDHLWLEELLHPSTARNGTSRLFRRQDAPTGNGGMGTNFERFIGSKVGCPATQKVIYMGVAADCEYVAKLGGQEEAKQQILTTWNSASALFKSTINVSLGITTLNVQDPTCPNVAGAIPWNIPCGAATLQERLSLMSQWRGTLGNDGNGLWHLMSGCPTGQDVGIAWLGTICETETRGESPKFVSGAAVSTAGRTQWQVVAHEIGHNFGAIHDCTEACTRNKNECCPLSAESCDAQGRFVMSPTAGSGEKVFSPCSLGNMCSVMAGIGAGKVDTSCLLDPDQTRSTISLQMCGNGIVERGEECDPGLGVESSCCDVQTCRFKNNAVCDPDSSPCCTAQCTFAPPTKVCRPSKDGRCDTAEMCTGNSSSCPTDIMAPNGQSCGSNGLACASGVCTSNSLQCQQVGSSMNLTQSCPDRGDKSCRISCQSPTQANVCIQLMAPLVDGSPCGYGGSCAQGKCQAGGWFQTATAWYRQNLQIAIPVSIAAGLVAILILWSLVRCILRPCRRNRGKVDPMPPLAMRSVGHERLQSNDAMLMSGANDGPYRSVPPRSLASRSEYTQVPPAAATHERGRSNEIPFNSSVNNHANWVDERKYNGTGGGYYDGYGGYSRQS